MRIVALVLAVLAAQPQDKAQDPKVPKEPIRDWKYRRTDTRFDPQTRAEIEEFTVLLQGREAVPVNFEKKIFDLRGVKANYFTTPEKNKRSKEIVVEADRGRYDHQARTLKLDDHVRVVKKNDDEKPPQVDTVLHASSALLKFNRMYECPTCRTPLKSAGKCALHDEPLKELTVTSLEVDSGFELAGPEGILSGEGLVTDDAIKKEYHIRKNGFVEFGGNPSAPLADPREAAEQPRFAQIFSRGPLHITGEERERKIRGEGGMRVDRIDPTGTLTVRAQDMTIESRQLPDHPPEIRDVVANGKVVLDGIMFEDGTAFQTTSDNLRRTLDAVNTEVITLKSSDVPVHVRSGPNTIESRSVEITRRAGETGGVSIFESVLRSDLVAGQQHFALKCDHLTTIAEPNTTGRTDLRKLVARGRVVLGGLMSKRAPGEDPGEAHADRFEWDVVTQRGWLEAAPFVRITQGASTILAPKASLESPSIIVLKGPKQVHLIQEREGGKEEYRATCDGDMVLDQGARRLWMRNACVIRTQDLLLTSDRVNAVLSKEGAGLDSLLALGRVHAVRRQDQTSVYGERLAYRFKDQDLKVYGVPYAWVESGRSTIRQEVIRMYEKENPKTKVKTRFIEHDGGPDGLRIEYPDRPKAGDKK